VNISGESTGERHDLHSRLRLSYKKAHSWINTTGCGEFEGRSVFLINESAHFRRLDDLLEAFANASDVLKGVIHLCVA